MDDKCKGHACLLEKRIERLLGGEIGHNRELDFALPFRVRFENIVCFGLRAHSRSDGEAALYVLVMLSLAWMGSVDQTSMRIARIWEATKPLAPVRSTCWFS